MGVGVLARVLDVKFMRWLNISLWKLIGAGLGGEVGGEVLQISDGGAPSYCDSKTTPKGERKGEK